MLLIATDEAGYGPKLGPLVIAASAWRIPCAAMNSASNTDANAAKLFTSVAGPVELPSGKIYVSDSKTVFRPASASKRRSVHGNIAVTEPDYAALEKVTLAGARWCGLARKSLNLVGDLAGQDRESIERIPWLAQFSSESIATFDDEMLEDVWRSGPAQLDAIQARVITAQAFNEACGSGNNKSDLLSATTLSLIKTLLDKLDIADGEAVEVFCDRHGGRRYYAGPLQSVFDDNLVQVNGESKTESSYRVPYRDRPFVIRFTVKGDTFTPVAFSSLVAKYLREKAMESFNQFFNAHWVDEQPLRPTAGYPVDADRFLDDIKPLIARHGIDRSQLVRCR